MSMVKLLPFARFAKNIGIDVREVVENIIEESEDFEVDDYRFIHEGAIDMIMEDDIGSDDYMLGCFNAHFLADALDIDQDVIDAMQKAEAFEAIGKLAHSLGKIKTIQEMAVSWDGYGHHFSHYDGSEESVGGWYVFRLN